VKTKTNRSIFRTFITSAGLLVVLVTGLAIMGGCASTRADTVSMAKKVHSMTPCGMMMGAMMENGHAGHQPEDMQHEEDSSVDQQIDP
jgi:hypothetical protein